MAASGWFYLPWWELAFRSDNSPVSWLSSALLTAAAVLAVRLGADGSIGARAAAALAAVLALLALDEQFMFHERIKYHWLPHGSPLGNWNNVVLIAGGAMLLVLFFRAVPLRLPRALMVAAVGVGWVALCTAIAGPHAPALLGALEEGLEVLSETLFVCALLEIPSGSALATADQVQSGSLPP